MLYREQGKDGPAVNVRRPFSLDLVYPIPELRPFIGKKNNLKEKTPKAPQKFIRVGAAPESGQVTDAEEQPSQEKSRTETTLGQQKRP